MTTYAEQANMKRCKNSKGVGCGEYFPIEDFPGSNNVDQFGKKTYVHGSLCRDCYNRNNRENEKRQQAKKTANTAKEDNAIMGMLYFSCVPAPAYSVKLRAERLGV